MKIYTKTGDAGETGLLGGIRVSKSHLAINVCGDLDELNSIIGLVRAGEVDSELNSILLTVQNDLFDLGGRVAGCLAETNKLPVFAESRFQMLESRIDEFQEKIPELRQFILPDGAETGCRIHLARAVCRRAERHLVAMRQAGQEELKLDLNTELIYLNRLSDFLFVAARFSNQLSNQPETPWKVGQ